ncbi:acetyltransferase, GNAT family [Pseudoalteromonas luteoviolacea B = ATCC 29581]|nr:acetyltransferase, GNAT family [Pseudoalteromonas luteoviolacea B = ATCC 29581]
MSTFTEKLVCLSRTGHVFAYLLAHRWNGNSPPKLYTQLPNLGVGDQLFLHDLAVSKSVRGNKVGSQLVAHLIEAAKSIGIREIQLVSVQNSQAFWRTQGFVATEKSICDEYGEDAVLMKRRLTAQNGSPLR